jgi:hypothetical protein
VKTEDGMKIKTEVFFEDPEAVEEQKKAKQEEIEERIKKIPNPAFLSKGMLYSAYGSQIARLVVSSEDIN